MQPLPPSSNQPNINELLMANLGPMIRQLDRLEERTRSIATRDDLEVLRKELITRDAFEPQLAALKAQIARVDSDRIDDHKEMERRLDKLEGEQISRQDRLWMRLSQLAAFLAIIISLLEFLVGSHLKLQ